MITLRQMAVAFLLHEDKLLFMEKPASNSFLPGMVVPIGGHLEQDEIDTPMEACLREFEEETGLTSNDITEINLKYIISRIKETEIRIQYVYFGTVKHTNVRESEEGKLFWTSYMEATKLNVTATTKYVLEHKLVNRGNSSDIYVGTMRSNNEKPEITWALLEDWENQK